MGGECHEFSENHRWEVQQMSFLPLDPIEHKYFSFDSKGIFKIKKGYMFDGCSGIAIDSKKNIRACAFHDALFQAMRENLLSKYYFTH